MNFLLHIYVLTIYTWLYLADFIYFLVHFGEKRLLLRDHPFTKVHLIKLQELVEIKLLSLSQVDFLFRA